MRLQKRLELTKPEFQVRAQNFFHLMSLPEFQQQFLSDPGGVAARELGLKSVRHSTISTANLLIHRVLSDANFNEWAKQFQERIEAEFPTIQNLESLADVADFVKAKENKIRLMEEFSRSVIAHLSPDSYQDLIDQRVVNRGLIRAEPDIALVPLTFIAVIVVLLVVAGYGRPSDKLSRVNLQMTINQLTPEQLQTIQARRCGP